jgi:ERCC4-type nuclease
LGILPLLHHGTQEEKKNSRKGFGGRKKLSEPIIIIDTREQNPWKFESVNWKDSRLKSDNSLEWKEKRFKLKTGDYSLLFNDKIIENDISIERKNLEDFICCCSRERERFERELQRSLSIKNFYIIIEGSLSDVFNEKYKSKVSYRSIIGSIVSIKRRYPKIEIVWAENRFIANRYAEYVLRYFYNKKRRGEDL